MLELKVGVQLASLKLPFQQALHTAARMRAAAVEIDARGELRPGELSRTGVRQIRKMLDDLDLRVSAVGFRTRRGYDTLEDLERRVDATRQALDMAYALGAPVVVNRVGRVPDEPGGPAWELLLATLAELGRYGQKAGALLAAETGGEPGPALARLIAELPPGSLAVDFHPANLVVDGYSASEAIDALGPHVRHVHARDAVLDPARRRGVEVPLGRGSVDFPYLLSVLEEHGYRGYLTVVRYEPESNHPAVELEQAITYLRNLG